MGDGDEPDGTGHETDGTGEPIESDADDLDADGVDSDGVDADDHVEDSDYDLTEGSLLRPLVALSAPIVLTQLLQVVYNLVDTFWVGRLGGEAVSALSFSWPPVFVLISLGGGLTLAGSVLVAQHKGAGNIERVNEVAGQTLAFVTVFSLALGAIGYLLAPTFLRLIGAEPGSTIFAYSLEYMRVIFLGVWFMFGFFVFQSLLRGWGDTRTPMYLMAVSVAVNVVLDPVFIFGFADNPLFGIVGARGLEASLLDATGFTGHGVRGAAMATIFSRALATVPGVALLFSGRLGLSLSLADLRLERETVAKIIEIGYPASIEQSSGALSYSAMTAVVALVSPTAVAAFGICARLTSFVFLPAVGLGMGVETAVGQNLGAKRADRARRAVYLALGMLAAAYVVVSAVGVIWAREIVGVFIAGPDAATVVDIGETFMRIVAPTFAFMGAFHVVKGCFNGAGNTRAAMIMSVTSVWGLQVLPAYVLVTTFDMGTTGAWWALAFMHVGSALIVCTWFLRGTWTESVVEDDDPTPAVAD
ncbi:MATE family efflux transporter [Halosimplex salinum]|uniref:MATE family efflux transporter n=1 Tax=Halosimplex salinum TaxID=1710538 RepID=UPI000F49DD48|nr:MATE family efflux transporter [Halosimplex salinum]